MSLSSVALNEISFSRFWISRAVRGAPRPLDRVDLDQDRVGRTALPDQRPHRWVAGVAAVPGTGSPSISTAWNSCRQARGRQQHVRRDSALRKTRPQPGLHVGHRDVQRSARPRGVRSRRLGRWLGAADSPAGLRVVGCEHLRCEFDGCEYRRVIARPVAGEDLDRTEAATAANLRLDDALPEASNAARASAGPPCVSAEAMIAALMAPATFPICRRMCTSGS